MRASLMSPLLAVFIIQVAACADQRESAAHEHMRQRVTTQSGGALALSSFSKTNGIEQNLGGMEFYSIEWEARLTVGADVWKAGNAIVGHWSDFGVMRDEPGMWDNLLGGGNAKEFVKGATVVLTGESQLQKTDNGWRVVGLDVMTSQVQNNVRSPAAVAERQRQQELARLEREKAQAAEDARRAQEAAAAAALAAEQARQELLRHQADRPRVEGGILGDWHIANAYFALSYDLTITRVDGRFRAVKITGNIREVLTGQMLADNRLDLEPDSTVLINPRLASQWSYPGTMWIELGADGNSLRTSRANGSSDDRWRRPSGRP